MSSSRSPTSDASSLFDTVRLHLPLRVVVVVHGDHLLLCPSAASFRDDLSARNKQALFINARHVFIQRSGYGLGYGFKNTLNSLMPIVRNCCALHNALNTIQKRMIVYEYEYGWRKKGNANNIASDKGKNKSDEERIFKWFLIHACIRPNGSVLTK